MFYLPSRLYIRNINATAYDVTYADKVLALPADNTILTEVTERFALFTEQEWNAMRVDHVDTGNVEFSWANIPLYSLYSCPVIFDADATVGGTDQIEVYNESGGTLGNLTTNRIVYLSGWDQTRQRFNIALADANSATPAARRAQYILPTAIANNAVGSAIKRLRLTAVDVSAGAEGDPIYLSATAGGWTRTDPSVADPTALTQIIGQIAVVGVAGPPATGVIEFDLGSDAPERVTTADIVPGALAASAAGRALMADDYFTTAETGPGAGGKFATGAFNAASLTEVVANDAITAAVWEAKAAAGAISATADGRASIAANFFDTATLASKIADDAFTSAEFAAGAGGKFAADALVTAGIANLIADDAFTSVEVSTVGAGGKFAAGAITTTATAAGGLFAAGALNTAGIANTVADDAFTSAEFAAGAGGKFAANALVTAGIQNLIADDAFTSAEFAPGAGGKFAANCIDTEATGDNFLATGSIGEDRLAANQLSARTTANTTIGAGVAAGGTRALAAAEFSQTTTVALVIQDGASNTYDFTGLPYKCRVIDAWSVNTAVGNAGNTYQVGNGGLAITDAFSSAGGDRDIGRAGEIDDANHEILAAGTIRVTTVRAGGSSAAIVYVKLLRVA